MDEQELPVAHHQGTRPQPGEQLVAIRRRHDVGERVLAVRGPVARGDRQQMEIVISEHGDRRRAESLDRAQHAERVGTAIDEVSDQPQPVRRRIEGDHVEQLPELGVAALDVADDVVTHA